MICSSVNLPRFIVRPLSLGRTLASPGGVLGGHVTEHKHMPEPVRRMEVFTGAGRRRSWSPAEKAAIIAESYGGGETVCGVARRHGLTPQQLFAWRRLARRSPLGSPTMFVPAVVEPIPLEPPVASIRRRRPRRRSKTDGIELEI